MRETICDLDMETRIRDVCVFVRAVKNACVLTKLSVALYLYIDEFVCVFSILGAMRETIRDLDAKLQKDYAVGLAREQLLNDKQARIESFQVIRGRNNSIYRPVVVGLQVVAFFFLGRGGGGGGVHCTGRPPGLCVVCVGWWVLWVGGSVWRGGGGGGGGANSEHEGIPDLVCHQNTLGFNPYYFDLALETTRWLLLPENNCATRNRGELSCSR